MADRAFAPWVAKLAATYAATTAGVAERARTLTAEQLALATGDEGWTVRDEVLHIAASDPDFIRTLGAILDGKTPDVSIFADIDGRNARNLAQWASRSMADVAAEIERNGGVIEGLLARLTADDEARQPDGVPFPLGALINGYGQHGPYHLGQIRAAIGEGT